MREGEQAVRVERRGRRLLAQPGAEADLVVVDGAPAAAAVAVRHGDQVVGRGVGLRVAREQDPGLFEELAHRARAVGQVVRVALDAGRGEGAVRPGQVAAGEDVRGGEGGRGADAVGQEDAVGGGDEDDAEIGG